MLTYNQMSNPFDRIERGELKVLRSGRTQYQSYLFFDSPAHGVCIALDGDLQSCEIDEAAYHEGLVHPAMLAHPDPRRVLVMGGGEGATGREVLRHSCVESLVVVDIDEEFVNLCKEIIPGWAGGAWEDDRCTLIHDDIRNFAARSDEKFDVIIGDLVDFSDPDSPAAALYSREFYDSLAGCAAEGAIFATQSGPLGKAAYTHVRQVRELVNSVFPPAVLYGVVVPSFYHLWGFMLGGAAGLPEPARMAQRADERSVDFGALGVEALAAAFKLPKWVQSIED